MKRTKIKVRKEIFELKRLLEDISKNGVIEEIDEDDNTAKAKKQLKIGIDGYVKSWFNSLSAGQQSDSNKEALRASYEWVAKKAVEVYKGKNKKESIPDVKLEDLETFN